LLRHASVSAPRFYGRAATGAREEMKAVASQFFVSPIFFSRPPFTKQISLPRAIASSAERPGGGNIAFLNLHRRQCHLKWIR